VPNSSHGDRFTTAARDVCTYLSVNLVVRQLNLIFSLTIVGKFDNMWPISTNWTICGSSVQIGQYVEHKYKLDNMWPISSKWAIRCPSVQINKKFKNRTKKVSHRMTCENVIKLRLPSTLFPSNSLPVCMHKIRGVCICKGRFFSLLTRTDISHLQVKVIQF
jgi:hypothetical protein